MFYSAFLIPLVLIALRRSPPVEAADVVRDLTIQNAQLAPNGVSRSTVTAEGQFPGPLISGNFGDRFLVRVTDKLTDPTMRRATSIHWHGMFQHHTPESDGPAFVTQCPIVPDHSFLYNFSVPDQTGTYWYHSHLSTQYCDGLRGPLVIYDPNDPHAGLYDVDDESTIVLISDWYNTIAPVLFPNPTNGTPVPDSTVINGKGRSSAGGDLAVVRAQPGKRHRLRLIAASCFPSFTVSLDGHKMTVIEADGEETEPVTVDSLNIFAAQRYSVVVEMDQPVDNYWIRAVPSSPAGSTTDGGINSAILRYDGAPDAEPTTNATANPVVLNEADLHPIKNPGAPGLPFVGGADLALQMQISRPDGQFEINGVPFNPPSVPVLLQILSGTTNANQLLPPGSVYNLPRNKVVEINFPGGGNHPIHLHGHAFDVIRVSGNSSYNFVNPVRRDVVSIGGGTDNVTFRFMTDNPGPWFLHCHINWHLEGGLAVVLAEAAEDIPSFDPAGPDWLGLCPDYANLNPDTNLTNPVA
ncbi:laccase [Fomitiporia mediterranea MF3/22]|uniref:laccase n=1 Tax=Fomitiporia mediterranea (strain MF3/22) TaxID=694068 RepID=UPI0004409166|nr:laccase [Fomitiporia mediterranea MF3/22]EJD00037.1 laccase [Fomitiporia mediterranea MF3/22]